MIWLAALAVVGIVFVDPVLALAGAGLVAVIVIIAMVAERGIGRNP